MLHCKNQLIIGRDLNVKKCQEYVFAQGYGNLCKSTKKYKVFATDTAFTEHLANQEPITLKFACPRTCRMYEGMLLFNFHYFYLDNVII